MEAAIKEYLLKEFAGHLTQLKEQLDAFEKNGFRIYSNHTDITEDWKAKIRKNKNDLESLINDIETDNFPRKA